MKKQIEKIKQLDTRGKEARDFSVLFAAILVMVVTFFDQSAAVERYLLLAALYFLAGIIWPLITKYPFLIWMSFSIFLGELMFRLLFSFFFFFLVTPIAWLKRFSKGDFLELKYDQSAPTYYKPYDSKRLSREALEKLY